MNALPQPYRFALLRSPLFSIDQLITQWEHLADFGDDALRWWLEQPLAEKALYIASPALHQVWQDWRNNPGCIPSEAARLALWRYVVRMSSRCTPFGLFAGVSSIFLSDQTSGVLVSGNSTLRTRPDMAWLTRLIASLEQHRAIQSELRYCLNNSLYQLGGQYRYSAYRLIDGQRSFYINSVERDELLEALLNHVKQIPKGVTARALIEMVQQCTDDTEEEAATYVDALINEHVLITELEPGVTGPLAFEQVLKRLRSIPAASSVVQSLTTLQGRLCQPDLSVAELVNLDKQMRAMLGEDDLPGDVLQTDMIRLSATVTVDEPVVEKINQQLTRLMPLRTHYVPEALGTFARRFFVRYGSEPKPLLVALDHESGIGYGPKGLAGASGHSALLQQLTIPASTPKRPVSDRLDAFRLAKLTDFLQTGQLAQTITDAELTQLAKEQTPGSTTARSWAVLGDLLGVDTEAIDNGQFQFVLKSATGPTAASLMTRFSTLDDALTRQVQELTNWEAKQYPDCLLAEIVHLPTGRVGNVVCRPSLRAYEIPYLTPGGVGDDHILSLSDLWIRVPDGKTVELWSKKHDKRVLPRNTTAHNYLGSDDIYRFLSDLSHQDESLHLRWSWGALADQPALPRLTYQNIVVARAQWQLNWQTNWVSANAMVDQVQQSLTLPRYVALAEADNELLLDLTVAPCRQILFTELRKRKTVRLVEWLATPEACWLMGEGGRFTGELVIPFKQTAAPLPHRQSPFTEPTQTVQRTFLPGSEWLYVKVYVGEQTADELLTSVIAPFTDEAIGQGHIQQWFFVRYYDPEPHLRLRFFGQPETNARVLATLMASLQGWIDQDRVQSVQIDTYEREVERYGTTTIEQCEQLFGLDSQWIIDWIIRRDELEEDEHWWVACQQADQMLGGFGFTLMQKERLMNTLQERFLAEHGHNPAMRKQLNEQYRVWHTRCLCREEAYRTRLQVMPSEMNHLIGQLRAVRAAESTAQLPEVDFIASLLHMHFNRFFSSDQRLSEGVVYHFLARRYASEQARQSSQMLRLPT
ncbi:lantibiotic dehydratase [Fibrella sp. HMF5335]|uniref:Lantibiotic dehydratase n=1 Tax=Fibrella rubiginis TaxID=2817060 RepID=A0A939K7B1_9BACT|nr:lantibiotic dehydratase [Fibrella rubiginis]MBO0939221.1 lantibiotic dehydratase [Fibrella rubiginis]